MISMQGQYFLQKFTLARASSISLIFLSLSALSRALKNHFENAYILNEDVIR